jgi:hypothetical protein
MILNVASPDCAESFFRGPIARCVNLKQAASLPELWAVLEQQQGRVQAPATLDGMKERGLRSWWVPSRILGVLTSTTKEAPDG